MSETYPEFSELPSLPEPELAPEIGGTSRDWFDPVIEPDGGVWQPE